MEIRITSRQILWVLYIIAWLIFVGLGIEAGGYISNTFYVMAIDPEHAKHFWERNDLSALYEFDRGWFLVETSLICITAVMKAIMFYAIIRILHDKKANLSQPFNRQVIRFIFVVCSLAFGIGLLSSWAVKYAEWFKRQGIEMPDMHYLGIGGGDVWLFMGVILFVIAQVFKRGIEIQTENELTV